MGTIDKDGLRRRGRSSQLPAVGRGALLEAALAPKELGENLRRSRAVVVVPGVIVSHPVLA